MYCLFVKTNYFSWTFITLFNAKISVPNKTEKLSFPHHMYIFEKTNLQIKYISPQIMAECINNNGVTRCTRNPIHATYIEQL